MLQPWMIPSDLAPGDRRSLEIDAAPFVLHRITSPDHPRFEDAYGALWREFGAKNELEQREVLARRMAWDPARPGHGCAFRYELLWITTQEDEPVAVRDHTAIVREGVPGAVVHMSHNLVLPSWRRTGIAGWLRALPVTAARECLAAQLRPVDSPICLAGEMEPPDASDTACGIRLTAYEKAGYRMADPARVPYVQPDFRPPEEIDAGGGPRPLPLCLMLRFVGGGHRESLPGGELRGIVESLYRMYAEGFREQDMAPLFAALARWPEDPVALIPPTSAL